MTLKELWKIMRPKAKVCVAERDGGEFNFAFVDAIYLPENERIMSLMDREVTEVVPRNNRLYVRVERDEPPSTIEELIRDAEEFNASDESVIVCAECFEWETPDENAEEKNDAWA